MVNHACVGDSPFLHASALHAETRSATLYSSYTIKSALSKTFGWRYATVYLSGYLPLSFSLPLPLCFFLSLSFFLSEYCTCDKLFRSISYVTIFSLVETTTTSPTKLISINANIRDAKCLHLNITVCATTGRCHCCQELGTCMYTHEKQHRAHVSPNLVRTYVPGFTLIDPRSSLRRKRGWAKLMQLLGGGKKTSFPISWRKKRDRHNGLAKYYARKLASIDRWSSSLFLFKSYLARTFRLKCRCEDESKRNKYREYSSS